MFQSYLQIRMKPFIIKLMQQTYELSNTPTISKMINSNMAHDSANVMENNNCNIYRELLINICLFSLIHINIAIFRKQFI
jgi:hypothetical protein